MIARVSLASCVLVFVAATHRVASLPPLSCDTFAAARSLTAIQSAIGSARVTSDSVPLGPTEGAMVAASVFFPDAPDRRLEVVWRGGDPARGPRYVRLRGQGTAWRTTEGVAIGTSLHRLEQLNGHAFHLAGFAFDNAATVTSWDGGRLRAPTDAACRTIVRLDSLGALDVRQRAFYKQVTGDRVFSSAHPAMQALNPRVDELLLVFPD